MRVEGIVLNKTPYKERDLICHLLLRSGKKISIYFYGGRGGGKKSKGSVLEVGFMLSVELAPRRKKVQSDIQIAKEHKLLWNSGVIRDDYLAFCLSCFYLEYTKKVATDIGELDDPDDEHGFLFTVLSNALFYLDESLVDKNFSLNAHLFIFLTKLSMGLGITGDVGNCVFCHSVFSKNEMCLFDSLEGGFSCVECGSRRGEFLSENQSLIQDYQTSRKLRESLRAVYQTPYKSYISIEGVSRTQVRGIFNYINYHFGLSQEQIKSWASL